MQVKLNIVSGGNISERKYFAHGNSTSNNRDAHRNLYSAAGTVLMLNWLFLVSNHANSWHVKLQQQLCEYINITSCVFHRFLCSSDRKTCQDDSHVSQSCKAITKTYLKCVFILLLAGTWKRQSVLCCLLTTLCSELFISVFIFSVGMSPMECDIYSRCGGDHPH